MPSDQVSNVPISYTSNEGDSDSSILRRLIPFLAATTAFAVMVAFYLWAPFPVYRFIVRAWGVVPYQSVVFLDTDTVLSAVRCVRKGVDVFEANPCDLLERVFDYSPLWLLLARLPAWMTELVPTGLIVVSGYFLSLLLLPLGKNLRESCLIALAAISTAAVFAVERGNNDLVLFALCAVAAALASRSKGLRLVGYGAALLAGLLKYYPLTTLAIASREKPARFALVVCLVLAGIGLFLLTMGRDLSRALMLIPTAYWYGAMFGSETTAGGLAELFGWPLAGQHALNVTMSVAGLSWALWLATRPRFVTAVNGLDETQRHFLLIGSLLMISCFFTAQNIGYRSVHLVLVMPSLLALARAAQESRLLRWSPYMVLILLWSQAWRHAVEQLDKIVGGKQEIEIATWLVKEVVWWAIIPLLIACATVLLVHSEMGRIVFRRPANRAGAPELASGT